MNAFWRPAWLRLQPLFAALAARRSPAPDPAVLYPLFLGGPLLFFGSGAEAAAITGTDVASEAAVAAFIALQTATVIGGSPRA